MAKAWHGYDINHNNSEKKVIGSERDESRFSGSVTNKSFISQRSQQRTKNTHVLLRSQSIAHSREGFTPRALSD